MACCGSTPAPPAAPDPVKTIAAQSAANTQAQKQSLVNQSDPYGSLNYTLGPNGQYTATTSLNPQQRALLTGQEAYQQSANTEAQSILGGFSSQNAGGLPNLNDQAGGLTQKLLGQETSYLNPIFDRQKEQTQAQLANQGLQPDSPAYKAQMQDLENNQNMSVSNFLATAEPAAFAQSVQGLELPLNIAAGLQGQAAPGSVANNLVNTGAAQVSPVNAGGLINQGYSNQLQGYQAQVGASNGALSGIGNILGAVATPFIGPIAGAAGGALAGQLFGGGSSQSQWAQGINSIQGQQPQMISGNA